MSLENLKNCLAGLESTKLQKKRSEANELIEIIRNEQLIKILNENHLKHSSTRWDHVLRSTHMYLLSEADKFYEDEIKKKTSGGATELRIIGSCKNLIMTVVQKARNNDYVYLSRKVALQAVLQVLDTKKYHKYFLQTYLNILTHELLPANHFRYHIKDVEWTDVVDVIKRLVERANLDGIKRIDLIKALTILFQYIPSVLLRTWVPLIIKEWEHRNVIPDMKKSSDILKMTNIFCQRVAVDCRMCLCQLGEAVMPNVISFYESRVEDYGGVKTILFDFLLLQITLHHPNGASEGSDLAHANDWSVWKDHIRLIHRIIYEEANCILKMDKLNNMNSNKSVIWDNYIRLAVEVLQQHYFYLSQNSEVSDEAETSSKRARKTNIYEIIIDEISSGKAESWLCILNIYLKRYSNNVALSNLIFLLSHLLNVDFSEQKERFQCFNCYLNLLEIEKSLENVTATSELNKLWSNVWENAVRSFAHHENEEICGLLIQKLLQSKPNLDMTSLLRIYESKKLTLNYIEVLNSILTYSDLSNEQINNIRNIFWEYILTPSVDDNDIKQKRLVFRSKITAHILTGFILKEFPVYINQLKSTTFPSNYNLLENFEMIYRKTHFMIGAETKSVNEIINKTDYRIDDDLKLINSNYLCQFLDIITTLKNKSEVCYETFLQILDVIIFSINITVFYKQYNIIEDVRSFRLTNEIVTLLDVLLTNFNKCFSNEYQISRLYKIRVEVLDNLNFLFDLNIPNDLKDYVYSIDSTKEICQKLFNLLEPEDSTDEMDLNKRNKSIIGNIFDENNFTKSELVSYRSWQVLCNFIELKCDELGSVQRGALKYIFNNCIKNINMNNLHDIRLILYFILHVSNSHVSINEEQLKIIFESLNNIFKKYEYNSEIILLLLYACNGLFKYVQKTNSIDLKNISVSFLELFTNVQDPIILKEFLLCIQHLIELNPEWNWKSSSNQHILWDKMIDCLYSVYHEIRLFTASTISNLFKSSKLSFKQKLSFLEDIDRKVSKLFEIDESIHSNNNEQDEIKLRTSTALYIYVLIICANLEIESFALMSILRLSTKITFAVFNRGFEYIKKKNKLDLKKFINNNLEYLLDGWYNMGNNIINFPYKKFGFNVDNEFFINNIDIITKIALKKNMSDLDEVCHKINKSVKDMIKDNFALLYVQILPLIACKEETLNYIKNNLRMEMKQIQINLEKMLSEPEIKELRVTNIYRVILLLIKNLNDYLYIEQICDIKVTNQIPMFQTVQFDYTTVTEIIEYLEKELNDCEPLIVYFATNYPAILEKLLLKLSTEIHSKINYTDQFISLEHYLFLCKWIERYFNNHKLKHIVKFLIRNISYNLIHIIINMSLNEQIRIAACHYFMKFCDRCIQTTPIIFKQYFHIIVNLLVPITTNNDTPELLRYKVLKLFKYLIIEKQDIFAEQMVLLESFPTQTTDLEFYSLKQLIDSVKYSDNELSLKMEICNFLKVDNIANISRLESLKKLKKYLRENKDELYDLYKRLEDYQNDKKDSEESIIHKLINSLIGLAKSTDEEMALAATMCLGEIGPLNLQTLILKVDHMKLADTFDIDISIIITGYIIKLLTDFTVDNDYEIKIISSRCLYAVLSSPDGQCTLCDAHKTIKYNSEPLDADLLVPFLPLELKSFQSLEFSISEPALNNLIQQTNLWWPLHYTLEGHETWLKDLVCNFLQIFESPKYFSNLIPLCRKRLNFCEDLLPLLIEFCMCKLQNENQLTQISNRISLFFENFWNKLSLHRQSLRTMLNVVNFNKFRSRRNHVPENKNILEINYLHVAKASLECSAYFTAVFYIECWCQDQINNSSQKRNISEINMIEALRTICPKESEIMEEILRKAYYNIGDLDAVNGCGVSHLLNLQDRTEHYSNLGYWDQSVLYYDINLSSNNMPKSSLQLSTQSLQIAYLTSLKKANLYHTANIYATNCTNLDFECLWRMNHWDINIRSLGQMESIENFEKFQYLALKSIYNEESVSEFLTLARKCVLRNINNDHMETTQNLYAALSKLQLIQEIEDFNSHFNNNKLELLMAKWNKQKNSNVKDFLYIEPIYAQRITLLEIAVNKTKEINYKKHLLNFQIDLTEFARKWKCYQVAKSALFKAKLSDNISTVQKIRLDIEEAELEWNMGLDKKIGPILLHKLLLSDFGINKLLHSKALRLYGTWMMETRSENPNKYLTEALDSLNRFQLTGREENKNRYATYAALAKFSSEEFQQVNNYLKSQAYEIKKSCIAKAKEVINDIKSKYTKVSDMSDDERRLVITNEKNVIIDETDIRNAFKMRDNNLVMAVKYYLLGLKENDEDNLSIFRLIALWIENRENERLNKFLEENLDLVPSYKYLPVLPQIAPHIAHESSNFDSFTIKINDIIEKCAIAHPFHVLPIILAIANANKDPGSNNKNTSSQRRISEANKLIKKLASDEKIKIIVENMLKVSSALINLAYLENSKDCTIPSNQPILRLKDVGCIHIPTLELPVEPSENYDKIIGIYKWHNKYKTLGGKSAPKRITCIGTDGISRDQLIKGSDDLRQDAVMQQVFSILNTLLKSKYNRDLLIRTYKIVPLSKKSGLIQWCDNSILLSEYLLAKNRSAHERYYPNDYQPIRCLNLFKDAATKDNEQKLQIYNHICANFRPVFHKFFWENYGASVASWWEHRRDYTLSVATTSMVGYILGLGDRHLSNILIDKHTAEIIHIDFGVAFEQGRILPTPETVPFRLTRDIEDGMGISGVEGVFRRSCEKTITVLRENHEIILTILQVLLYDPLYMWQLTTSKAIKFQRGAQKNLNNTTQAVIEDKSDVNKMAERALLRLTQKLQGTEDGHVSSIEGQVEKLIQEARNPVNLCRLYYGWQPYA